jgi:peptide/nickel transport system ATP-binding protein
VEHLTIEAKHGRDRRLIVSELDLTVDAGETIGIVGESGSGKSLTARALIGLLPRGVEARGKIEYGGTNLLSLHERALRRMRGSEFSLVFQDPFTMLNPLRRCGRHITEQLHEYDGETRSRKWMRAEAIRRFAEVGLRDAHLVNRYPFELSGGMRQRVGIAAALARDPKLLIADEPSTALDVTTQREILQLLKSLQRSRGMGLIMITHDLRVAFSLCDRIYVLYAGQLVEIGAASALRDEPRHPYTLGLLLSEPPLNKRISPLHSIPGSVPAAELVRDRCAFASRCTWAAPVCIDGRPVLQHVAARHTTACLRTDEIRAAMTASRSSLTASRSSFRSRRAVLTTTGNGLILHAAAVRKVFGAGHYDEVVALNGVSLDIGEKESVALVGESGSGKTTFGRCVVGLEKPTSGSISVAGTVATDHSLSAADLAGLRRTVQFVFQDPYSSLNPALTIGQALAEVIAAHRPMKRHINRDVEELLARVGLPCDYKSRKPVALSGGERQRVAIARALAVRPKLLICDEPVSALDVSVQAQIINLFAQLREELGMSYLFISHDLAVVRQVAERAYVLCKGEVVETGTVDKVLDAPTHPYTKELIDAVPRTDGGWLTEGSRPSVMSER